MRWWGASPPARALYVSPRSAASGDKSCVGKAGVTLHRPGLYRGTSLIRNRQPVGSYSRTMPRLL